MLVYSRTLSARLGYDTVSFRTSGKVLCRDLHCLSQSLVSTTADTGQSPARPPWVAAIPLRGV